MNTSQIKKSETGDGFRLRASIEALRWRMDCRHVLCHQRCTGDVTTEVKNVVRYAARLRLMHAYEPIFSSLTRIETLLKALKYIGVVLLLLASNHAEARHVRHHRSSHVADSVHIYEPARVEHRKVSSVFDTGTRNVGMDYIAVPAPVVRVNWIIPIPNTVPKVQMRRKEVPPTYGRMIMAAGVMVLFAVCLYVMTGRHDNQMYERCAFIHGYSKEPDDKDGQVVKVTLVETRWWLPTWISKLWCHTKHNLRLR